MPRIFHPKGENKKAGSKYVVDNKMIMTQSFVRVSEQLRFNRHIMVLYYDFFFELRRCIFVKKWKKKTTPKQEEQNSFSTNTAELLAGGRGHDLRWKQFKTHQRRKSTHSIRKRKMRDTCCFFVFFFPPTFRLNQSWFVLGRWHFCLCLFAYMFIPVLWARGSAEMSIKRVSKRPSLVAYSGTSVCGTEVFGAMDTDRHQRVQTTSAESVERELIYKRAVRSEHVGTAFGKVQTL